jgi:protease-4
VGVAAERIVANPGTITGSIGVILRGNNLSKLLERVGISFETVKSGLYKDILSPDRALTDEERQLLQSLIDSSYGQFVAAVSEGRGLAEDQVRAFADGRVFSGAQALELSLVDELGDEERARELACSLAGLDPVKTRPTEFGDAASPACCRGAPPCGPSARPSAWNWPGAASPSGSGGHERGSATAGPARGHHRRSQHG